MTGFKVDALDGALYISKRENSNFRQSETSKIFNRRFDQAAQTSDVVVADMFQGYSYYVLRSIIYNVLLYSHAFDNLL